MGEAGAEAGAEPDGPRALRARAEDAVQMARAAGAAQVRVVATSEKNVVCELRDGRLEQVAHSHARALSLQIYVDGRFSEHRTSDLREASLRGFLRDAVALTRAMEPDPHRGLPDPALYEGRAAVDLDLVDPTLIGRAHEARMELGHAIDERLAAAPGLLSRTVKVVDGQQIEARVASNGFSGVAQATDVTGGALVTLADQGDRRAQGMMFVTVRHLADLPAAAWLGDEALARAQARRGSRKGPTLETTLVVDRLAAWRLLGALLEPASGKALQQERSLWVGRQGEPVVSPRLVVTDEPLVPRSLGGRLYDAEGIAARPRTVIEGGTLRSGFIDCYYARKLGVPPTTGDSSNLVVRPDQGDLPQLVADVGEGIYVTSWMGGNADPTSGAFSLGLRGHLIERGTVGPPVEGMVVTGNLLELFSGLRRVGGDPWIHSPLRSPSLVFEGVSFSGG